MFYPGKELHAFVCLNNNEVNPLKRVQTYAFSNKKDLEAALTHIRHESGLQVLKSQVHVEVSGMRETAETFASLVTYSKSNTKRMFIQLFKSKEDLDTAIEMLSLEFNELVIASMSSDKKIMSYVDFRNDIRGLTRVN